MTERGAGPGRPTTRARVYLAVLTSLVAASAGAYEPWRALTSSSLVDERPSGLRSVLTRDLVGVAHPTSGRVSVLRGEGQYWLALDDLATEDGVGLEVRLSELPSGEAPHAYQEAGYRLVGELKATHGSFHYPIDADVDLTWLRSVVIWCDGCGGAFATAPLLLP